MINRYFELVAFAVNGEVAEEVFYLTDTVNMLQVLLASHYLLLDRGCEDSYQISFSGSVGLPHLCLQEKCVEGGKLLLFLGGNYVV